MSSIKRVASKIKNSVEVVANEDPVARLQVSRIGLALKELEKGIFSLTDSTEDTPVLEDPVARKAWRAFSEDIDELDDLLYTLKSKYETYAFALRS